MNIPQIRIKGFDEEWNVDELDKFFTKVLQKNSKIQYKSVLTNSAEYGVIDQREYFDHNVANENSIGGYYVVEQDDFVYNPRVSVTAPVGPINRNQLGYAGVISPLYLVFKIDGVDKDFLCYYYKTSKWHKYMKLTGNCGARYDRLSISDEQFSSMPITYPLSDIEQHSIASFFRSLDSLINSTSKKLTSLKQIKAASLQTMFPQNGETKPKVRFKGFDGDWEKVKFGSLIKECLDKSVIENEDVLLSSAISGMYLNSELFGHQRGHSNIGYRKLKRNMLVLSAQNLHLGNANVNLRFESGLISPAYKIYHIINVLPKFMAHWIKREETKDFFLNATTAGASLCRKNIVWEDLYNQSLLIPSSIDEQQKIADCFTNLNNQISLQEKRLEKLKQIKSACLDKMFV